MLLKDRSLSDLCKRLHRGSKPLYVGEGGILTLLFNDVTLRDQNLQRYLIGLQKGRFA